MRVPTTGRYAHVCVGAAPPQLRDGAAGFAAAVAAPAAR